MGQKADNYDFLCGHENAQTPEYVSLYGFRKSISKHLGLKACPMVTHDNIKQVLEKDYESTYPYGYFKLISYELIKEDSRIKAIGRHSSSITLEDMTNASINKGYLFPIYLGIEFHYIDNSFSSILSFISKMAIIGGLDGFSFEAKIPGVTPWICSVKLEQGPVSVPTAELESPQEPGAIDMAFNFNLRTKTGLVKSVAKINNEGRVTKGYDVIDNMPQREE